MTGELTSVALVQSSTIDTETSISDYSNTANFYADSLTPGVSLVSASGHDYASPVPEASSCLSFGGLLVGLGGMAVRIRRRRPVSRKVG